MNSEIGIPTYVGLMQVSDGLKGLRVTSKSGSMRTTSGLALLNEWGKRIVDRTEEAVGILMQSSTKSKAVEWLEFIDLVEQNVALTNVCDAFYCAAVKIAALRTIALPTSLPVELKGIAV